MAAWKRAGWTSFAITLAACGASDERQQVSVGQVKQDDASDGISVTPNPCMPSVGGSTCSVNVSWTELHNTTMTYQVAVRTDNEPWKFFACIPPNNPLRNQMADWIVPNQSARFSLRKKAGGSCAALDPTFQEVAVTPPVEGRLAVIQASPERVFTPTFGSTNVTWDERYAGDVAVWVRKDDVLAPNGTPLYFRPACGVSGGSFAAPWIWTGSNYRFSLNLAPQGCGFVPAGCSDGTDCRPDGAEIAAVTVSGHTDYVAATPNPCSAASGSSCGTTISWGTANTSAKNRIWVKVGTSAPTQLVCVDRVPDMLQSAGPYSMNPGTNYVFYLDPTSNCTNPAPAFGSLASTTAKALAGFVVRENTALKLNGQP